MHGVRPLEFYRLRERDDQTSDAYQLFQERFVRSLKENQFPAKFANALAGVLVEVTDNVIQHSRREPGEYDGLAAYHVEPGYMAAVVIDVGQGVLASLTHSPDWEHLQTSEQALRAAVIDHASCRPGQPQGEGFRFVLKSLAERNCRLRFRSGDAALRIEEIGGVHDGTITGSPQLCGLQFSICCALKGPPDERPILFS
jgi:anti-sigma regulatory factor (Ser/Thr protein kinase)